MKKLLRDALGRFKSVKINLLDGQRRGETIFRRAFFILVMFTIVALLGMLLIEKEPYEEYIKEVEQVDAREEGVDGAGNVVREGDVVNGQEVVVEDGKAAYIVNYTPELDAIEKFVLEDYPGSRIDRDYLDKLELYCDSETLKVVIGISVAESGMGKAVNRNSNFFGWFKGGNRAYDPDRDTMAREICEGVSKSYMSLGKNAKVTSIYTGSDRSSNWSNNFNWAVSQMEVK
jgi:hypothetical protein